MRIFIVAILIVCGFFSLVADVLSPLARISLAENVQLINPKSKTESSVSVKVKAFDADIAMNVVEQLGGTVNMRVGNLFTATLPLEALEKFAESGVVERIDFPRVLTMANDSVRAGINIFPVNYGVGLPQSYLGEGVIYGTFDIGIDFNHASFKDINGRCRILSAYLPSNKTGHKVEGRLFDYEGVTVGALPGSEFYNDELEAVCCDTDSESHGTHTIGTAAGSYMNNPYYGVAPKSDIIACGSEVATDQNILNSIGYIFDRAGALGKPAVVNISFEDNLGPHNGTSFFCEMLEKLVGPGRIVVVSAGNQGGTPLHVTAKSKVKTIINYGGEYATLNGGNGYFQIYTHNGSKFTVRFVVLNRSTLETVYVTPEIPSDVKLWHHNTDSQLNDYFAGEILAAGEQTDDGYTFLSRICAKATNENYCLGIEIVSTEGTELDVRGDGNVLSFGNLNGLFAKSGWVEGTPSGSISDMATGENVISVGAWAGRNEVMNALGVLRTYTDAPYGDIADFSSYGPDLYGNSKPDVVAPGYVVVSGISAYFMKWGENLKSMALAETIDGHYNRWGMMWGTSMSSPAVAGAIATWLQVRPQMTPAEVKTVLQETSRRDEWTDAAPQKWGAGKFDAYEGMKKVLEMSGVETVVTDKCNSLENADDAIYDIQGRKYSIGSQLYPGVYILSSKSGKKQKIVIK